MADIITNLHPDNDPNTNLYPNIKKENIPSKSISTDKLDNNVLSLIGSLKPSGTDTSTNILAFTSNKGIYVATDNGHWYYWNGSAYTNGGVYQSSEDIKQIKEDLTNEITARQNAISAEANRAMARENEIEALFTLPTEEAVNKWLNDHPEATTTVQDGSLTESKFSNALKLKVIKDYITPQMFGAVGDGVTDDTEALRDAVYYSHTNGNILFFPNDKKYYVTGSLNYYDNAYYNCNLNMLGCNPTKHGEYALSIYGGIIVDDDVALFQQANIHGSIRNLSIVGRTRNTGTSFFKSGIAQGLTVYGCNISQFGAFFRNCTLKQNCVIDSNTFLTVYYFGKIDSTTDFYGCVDSLIINNYINGGVELNDNYCFGWISFNGSTVANNFVDYYRVIYEPHAYTNTVFQGGISQGNQYQVFRHFTWFAYENHVISSSFVSENDCFNWTDENGTLAKLKSYTPYTYVDVNGDTQNFPPSIFRYDGTGIIIKNAIIQSNVAMRDIISVLGGTTDTIYSYGEFSCNLNELKINVINTFVRQGSQKAFYNNGNYKYNQTLIIGAVISVDSIPNFAVGWSDSFPCQKILYNNTVYTATLRYINGAWTAQWLDKFGNTPT